VHYGTARRKPFTQNPTKNFDDNGDGIDENMLLLLMLMLMMLKMM
jgi:hypothetical protein